MEKYTLVATLMLFIGSSSAGKLFYYYGDIMYIGNRLNYTQVPPDIPPNVTHIELKYNFITEIQDNAFTHCTQLESLDVSSNHINYFSPTALAGLSEFTSLSIGDNDLTDIPDLSAIKYSLASLSMYSNAFSTYDTSAFLGYTAITSLSISGDMTTLPNISSFSAVLESLSLSYNDLTEIDPQVFEGCNNLITLKLSYNQLSSFPYIPNLQSISILYFDSNLITAFENLTLGHLDTLTDLSLQRNTIKYINPENFTTLVNLKKLNLAYNQLEQFPSLQGTYEGLMKLDLASNRLTQVPNTVLLLTHLTYLGLKGNKLNTILDLSPSLTSLSVLDVRLNNLDCRCGKLEWLAKVDFIPQDHSPCAQPPELNGIKQEILGWRQHWHTCSDPASRFNKSHQGKRQISGLLSTTLLRKRFYCASLCVQDIWCGGFNLAPLDSTRRWHYCELFHSNVSPDFESKADWDIYEINEII